MNTEQILKKLEEIKVDTLNNLHSDDTESPLQVESETEFPLDEDAAGEDTKKEPILGEESKDPYYRKLRNLSRVTPMDGAESPPEGIYTSGEKKAITTESIQNQLDDLKKVLKDEDWEETFPSEQGRKSKKIKNPVVVDPIGTADHQHFVRAQMILQEAEANPDQFEMNVNDLEELKLELAKPAHMVNVNTLKIINQRFPQGFWLNAT